MVKIATNFHTRSNLGFLIATSILLCMVTMPATKYNDIKIIVDANAVASVLEMVANLQSITEPTLLDRLLGTK